MGWLDRRGSATCRISPAPTGSSRSGSAIGSPATRRAISLAGSRHGASSKVSLAPRPRAGSSVISPAGCVPSRPRAGVKSRCFQGHAADFAATSASLYRWLRRCNMAYVQRCRPARRHCSRTAIAKTLWGSRARLPRRSERMAWNYRLIGRCACSTVTAQCAD